MIIKSLTGSSIHATLIEARRLFGDDVVLLESVPPGDGRPARITIMLDKLLPVSNDVAPARIKKQPAMVQDVSLPVLVESEGSPSPVLSGGFGYGLKAAMQPSSGEGAAIPPESFSEKDVSGNATRTTNRNISARSGARDRIFSKNTPAIEALPSLKPLEDRISSRLDDLQARLTLFEERLANAFIGASQPWMTHTLYGALLAAGLKTSTLTRLFTNVWKLGYDRDDDLSKLRWAIARELCGMLNFGRRRLRKGVHVFIGPSGAGKTSLQIKLSIDQRFFGRHDAAVIVIAPENDADLPYQCPVDLYRRFELAVQMVHNSEEMDGALSRIEPFSHVLIDTPPMPMRPDKRRPFLSRMRHITQGIAPLQVHLVMNTARVLDEFDTAFLESLPLCPDTLALTHLDETHQIGRVAECLMSLKLPVQFTSDGPNVRENIDGFSATWLVEQLLDMQIVTRNDGLAWSML